METIDIDEVKKVAAQSRERAPSLESRPGNSKIVNKDRDEIQGVLKSYLDKAGLPVDHLNELLTSRQAERRKTFAAYVAEQAKGSQAAEAEFLQATAYRRDALEFLRQPFQSTFTVLDKPFLIWQTPHPELDIFIDSRIESMNSSLKIRGDKHSGREQKLFTFYFIWTNESSRAAVVNAETSLTLNGLCEVVAANGIFSGHDNYLNLKARLSLIRWTGWGSDPTTGVSNDQKEITFRQPAQEQQIAFLHAKGGGLFGDIGIADQAFRFEAFRVSADLTLVPAGATMLFNVSLQLDYDFSHGSEFDHVIFDFATDQFGRRIVCPLVALELLTQA